MEKFCKWCGKKINEDAVICIHCGRQVEELKSSNPTIINNNAASSSSSAASSSSIITNEKKKPSWFWIIFWLLMFFPIGIVLLIIRLSK